MTTRILLTGATGLIGHSVEAGLLSRHDTTVTSLTRRQTSACSRITDFEQLCREPEITLRSLCLFGADIAISCLGTTIRAAGSEDAMFHVDHDYVLAFARGARSLGARQFILVSSVGAGGPGFYLKTKGITERDICALGFPRVDILRPGLLLGHRATSRPLETLGQHIATLIAPLMNGKLSRYSAIPAETVARAIVSLSGQTAAGVYIFHNTDMRRLAAQDPDKAPL